MGLQEAKPAFTVLLHAVCLGENFPVEKLYPPSHQDYDETDLQVRCVHFRQFLFVEVTLVVPVEETHHCVD